MTGAIGVDEARRALAALPHETRYGEIPSPADVYLPRSHVKALDLDTLLVTGMRGTGKTFWWSALQEPTVRRLISGAGARRGLSEDTEVRIGFGVKSSPDDYPSRDELRKLLAAGVEPRTVWRAVQACHMAPDGHPLRRPNTWADRAAWVDASPEVVERLFLDRDAELDRCGGEVLLLFDALDRCADDWKQMYRLIRGLLQTALDVRPYRRLRVKVFLRTDQVDEAQIGDFPDASKVLSSSVELSWPRTELYGWLWHLLANGACESPLVPYGATGCRRRHRRLILGASACPALRQHQARRTGSLQNASQGGSGRLSLGASSIGSSSGYGCAL